LGVFLRAAYQTLKRAGQPLSSEEITKQAIASGLLESTGKTPWQTMKSKLSTDILLKNENSLFMRSEAGKFALREWKDKIEEHVADRYQKALFDEDILVFPASFLSEYIPCVGLYRDPLPIQNLVKQCRPMRRRLAEEDFEVIQLVSAFIVRCEDQILTYKRTKRLPESRLHDYYSLAFGGHLNPDDLVPLFSIFDISQAYPMLERELHEEIRFPSNANIQLHYRGLLYDNSRPVSCQHIGVVYEVLVDTMKYEIGERGFLMDAKYESISMIKARIDQFENWSAMLVKELEVTWKAQPQHGK
jgi:predicted NUDIX family phosphoesterase